MGTTLTSYVYVWQTIEESEDAAPLEWLHAREAGATAGILFGVVIFWSQPCSSAPAWRTGARRCSRKVAVGKGGKVAVPRSCEVATP